MGTTEYAEIKYLNRLPRNLYSAVSKATPFYHTDFKNSLENIVLKEEPESEQNLIGKVFADKSKSLKATIKALFTEITLREQVNTHLLNRIDDDVSKQCTYMANLENLSFNYSPDLPRELNNTKMQHEGKLLELEKEKRNEYLECWRDLMFLKKYLFMSLKDYWDISKRRDALAFEGNKLIENDKSKGKN